MSRLRSAGQALGRAAVCALLFSIQAATLGAAPPNPHRGLSQHVLDHWHGSAGLSDGTIFDLAQTADGYLWLGTRLGLFRFDGWHFELFDSLSHAAFSSDGVTALTAGPDGRLWIGGMDGSLLVATGDEIERLVEPDPESSDSVLSLFVDGQDRLWAWRNRSGPTRYSTAPDGFEDLGAPAMLQDLDLPPQRYSRDALARAADGSLWLATAGAGALGVADGALRRVDQASGLSDDFVKTVVPDTGGGLWLLTERGVHHLRGGELQDRTRELGLDPAGSFNDLHLDRSGALWIAGRQLWRWFEGRLGTLDADLGVDPRLFEDRDGYLWIASRSRGLFRLRRDGVTPVGAAEGLDAGFTLSVHQARGGELWLGTSRRGVYVLGAPLHAGTVDGRLTVADGLPHDRVWSIAEGRAPAEPGDSRFWLGTDGGLVELRGRRVERVVTRRDGLPQDRVRLVYQDPADAETLWLGTVDGGLARWRGGEATVWTRADGLADDAIRFVHRDGAGWLWIGQATGLSRLRGERLESFTKRDGLASTRLRGIFEDSRGRLWFGTSGGGVSRFDGSGFRSYGRAQGLEMRDVWAFDEQAGGLLWLVGSGQSLVALDSFDALDRGEIERLEARAIDSPLLTRVTCCVAGGAPVMQSLPGGVAAPTVDGVVLIERQELLAQSELPAVRIESVLADGRDVPVAMASEAQPVLHVPAGTRELSIDFACPSLPAAERLRFRYRLDGDDWTDAGSRRTTYLSRARPGKYRFEVQAAIDGDWRRARSAAVFLHMPPHWWQSPWFRAALVLLLAAAGFAWHRLRLRRIAGHNADLRREIDRRQEVEQELRRQVDRTRAALAELEQRQNQLNHVSRVAVLGESSAAFAHELRQPLAALITNAQAARRFLAGDPPDLAEIADIVCDMIDDGQRAADLLQRLHELLQHHEVHTESIELGRLLGDTAKLMRGEADLSHLTIELEVDSQLPRVEADAVHLQQALVNLTRNALEAMATTPAAERRLVLRAAASEQADWVELAVRDSGPGFARDPQQLFLPFLTTKPGGLGMGLAICRSIVDSHGGTIKAHNPAAGGAEVVISLPTTGGGAQPG